jgi:polysaccharide export outer membrane protein
LSIALLLSSKIFAQSTTQEVRIGVGDVINVKVYDESELHLKVKVGASGKIKFMLIGTMTVVDKTVIELSEELEAEYAKEYLVSPDITVHIERFRPFFVRGAVKNAGIYEFQFDMTIEKAIAAAGGLKDRASRDEWYVISGSSNQKIKVKEDALLRPGDILEIHESLF